MRIKRQLVFLIAIVVLCCGAFFINSSNVHAATVKLSKSKITIRNRNTKKIKIKGTTKKVKWSSSNKNVATVKNGKIKAKRKGKTTVTAKVNGKTYKCKVTVIGKNDYNSKLTETVIINTLKVPKAATYNVEFGDKYFWTGGGCYMVHIVVEGTGKYSNYLAFADFTMTGGSKSIWRWTNMSNY